jgi:hypothetical protein
MNPFLPLVLLLLFQGFVEPPASRRVIADGLDGEDLERCFLAHVEGMREQL